MIFLFIDFGLLGLAFVLFIILMINGADSFALNTVTQFKFLLPYLLFGFPLVAAIVKTILSGRSFFTSILKAILYFISSFLNILVLYAMFWYLIVFKPHDSHIAWLETLMTGIFMMLPVAAHILLTNSTRKDVERSDKTDITLILIAIVVSLATLAAQFLLIRQYDSVTLNGITKFLFG